MNLKSIALNPKDDDLLELQGHIGVTAPQITGKTTRSPRWKTGVNVKLILDRRNRRDLLSQKNGSSKTFQVIETTKTNLRRVATEALDLFESGLSNDEKALLFGMSTRMDNDELEFFIALNLGYFVKKHRKLLSPKIEAALDLLMVGKIKKSLIDDYVELAKLSLGADFDTELNNLKRLLKETPSSIDRSLMPEPIKFALSHLPSGKKLDEITMEYLLHIGQEPTRETMAKTRPKILNACRQKNLGLFTTTATFDPNFYKTM